MSSCILCGEESPEEYNFSLALIDSYRERQKSEKIQNEAGHQVTRESTVKQVLLQGPAEQISGNLCPKCLKKSRRKNIWGMGLSLGAVLLLLLANLVVTGLPIIFMRIGLFLSLVLLLIFSMPLFRPKTKEVVDQFFLKVRGEKEEPVISLEDISYYYGRKVKHWMMIRSEHWDELEKEDQLRVLDL